MRVRGVGVRGLGETRTTNFKLCVCVRVCIACAREKKSAGELTIQGEKGEEKSVKHVSKTVKKIKINRLQS